MSLGRSFFTAVLLLASHGAMAQADNPHETVSWAVKAANAGGGKLSLVVTGAVQPGWHVYGLKQAPEGPTPLLVTLDANTVAAADGAVAGTPAIKFRDPAFGLDTQYYEKDFSVTVPVRLKSGLAAGAQTIPVAVRFQTCNGRICQPPRTVHLNASVNLAGG